MCAEWTLWRQYLDTADSWSSWEDFLQGYSSYMTYADNPASYLLDWLIRAGVEDGDRASVLPRMALAETYSNAVLGETAPYYFDPSTPLEVIYQLAEKGSTYSSGPSSLAFIGGAYGQLRRLGTTNQQVHHMPADSVSPLSRMQGPAITMDIGDHMNTSSWGNSKEAQAYRAYLKGLIDAGRVRDAMTVEIHDVRRVGGNRYNAAIQQMLNYAKSLGMLDKK